MKLLKSFVMRCVAGEYCLIPVGDVHGFDGVVALNDVGARIWELLPDAMDSNAIVDALEQEYDAPRDTLTADTEEFLSRLREMGIVE